METASKDKGIRAVSSSYRTYEEWKRFEGVYDTIESDGSYRTYEEWKRIYFDERRRKALRFLPYL